MSAWMHLTETPVRVLRTDHICYSNTNLHQESYHELLYNYHNSPKFSPKKGNLKGTNNSKKSSPILRAHLVNCITAEDRTHCCPGTPKEQEVPGSPTAHKFRGRSHLKQVASVLTSTLTSSLGYIVVRSHFRLLKYHYNNYFCIF